MFIESSCLFSLFHSQAVNPLNNLINDPNSYSILGRILRITDDVITYRHWIRKTFPVTHPSPSSSSHHLTPSHPATPPTPPVAFHTHSHLQVSSWRWGIMWFTRVGFAKCRVIRPAMRSLGKTATFYISLSFIGVRFRKCFFGWNSDRELGESYFVCFQVLNIVFGWSVVTRICEIEVK